MSDREQRRRHRQATMAAKQRRQPQPIEYISERERERRKAQQQRAFSIAEFCERNKICRDSVYKQIREKRLKAHKCGKSTLIFDTDEAEWRSNLPLLELPAA